MPPTYLAGFRGSPASSSAIDFAGHLAELSRARTIAVTAYPTVGDREDAVALLERLAFDAVTVRIAVHGFPAPGLIDVAETERASLIVIGSTEQGPLHRLLQGGTAGELIHAAPCAVAVVPAGTGDRSIATVAVAFDESIEARAALREGRALARRHHARLVLLAAGSHEQGVRHAAEIAGADAVILDGDPVEAIIDACSDGIDVLLCGSRAHGPMRTVTLGSVSHRLVDRAPCPVIVLPRGGLVSLGPVTSRRRKANAATGR